MACKGKITRGVGREACENFVEALYLGIPTQVLEVFPELHFLEIYEG